MVFNDFQICITLINYNNLIIEKFHIILPSIIDYQNVEIINYIT